MARGRPASRSRSWWSSSCGGRSAVAQDRVRHVRLLQPLHLLRAELELVEDPRPPLRAAVAHHPEADARDAEAGVAEPRVLHQAGFNSARPSSMLLTGA